MPNWERVWAADISILKNNLLKYYTIESTKLSDEIKIITACIERSKIERGFIDQIPQIKLKAAKSSNLSDEINDLKIENARLEISTKSLVRSFVEKNTSIFSTMMVIDDILALFTLPEGQDYKDFEEIKTRLESSYKHILKITLDRIELELKTQAMENTGKEISEKYEFLYLYSKEENKNLKEYDTLVATIKSIDVENDFLQKEIERMLINLKDIKEELDLFDSLHRADINEICKKTIRKKLALINLTYADIDEPEDYVKRLSKTFKDDYHIDTAQEKNITSLLSTMKKNAMEVEEISLKLEALKNRSFKIS